MDSIPVLIVDDHPVVRDGLRYMLRTSPHIEVVAEASTGIEAVEKVRAFRPSVVLMDIEMPDMDGLEATRRIKERFPETSVIVLTVHRDDAHIAEAVKAGVAGYLLKDASHEEVCHAVESAVLGEVAMKVSLLSRAVTTMRGAAQGKRRQWESSEPGPDREGLSSRERAVLGLLVEGKSNKEIGAELFISPGTAKKHVQSILAKLGASTRADAAATAVRLGIVE